MPTPLFDSYRTKGLRKQLVERLRERGICDEAVLKAIAKIPRHLFMDSAFLEHAYQDKPFSIGEGQTISQPYTVAVQTSLLEIRPGDKILEIGTGSGYQSSILMEMGAVLYSVEYHQRLHDEASFLLSRLGYRGTFLCGDGSLGWEKFAPYDGIIVTAGAPSVPQALKDQLEPEGKLVLPVGKDDVQEMCRLTKLPEGMWKEELFGQYSFVPLRGKEGWG